MRFKLLRCLGGPILLLCLGGVLQAQGPPTRPEFWLGSIDPVVQNDRKSFVPADYMQLFAPGSPWTTVAGSTSTFEISTQLVLRGTPEIQQPILQGLRARHIKLAGQFGLLEQPTDSACGPHLEGLGTPAAAWSVAKKLHDIGAQLDYLDMDEPVTWGHNSPRNKCPQAIPDMAALTVKKVAIYRQYFPNVKVNLIDAVGSQFPRGASDEILFIDLLGKQGVHIDYFLADVQWGSNWQPAFEDLATRLHVRGIKVGLYCDGKLTSKSDAQWDKDSVANCKAAGNDPKIAPDMFMIGSWSPLPTHVLPEDQEGTLTHISKQLMNLFSAR